MTRQGEDEEPLTLEPFIDLDSLPMIGPIFPPNQPPPSTRPSSAMTTDTMTTSGTPWKSRTRSTTKADQDVQMAQKEDVEEASPAGAPRKRNRRRGCE